MRLGGKIDSTNTPPDFGDIDGDGDIDMSTVGYESKSGHLRSDLENDENDDYNPQGQFHPPITYSAGIKWLTIP